MENRSKIIIDYYNIINDSEVNTIGEIPEDKLELITVSRNADLMRTITHYQRKRGLSLQQIANKYNISSKLIWTYTQ